MPATKLKVGFSSNPRLKPLLDGAVTVEGVEFEWEFGNPGALFHRQLSENCFDMCEFSIADYLVTAHRPDWAHVQWLALPVFISKPLFLLRKFHVWKGAGIKSFADFGGKRLGVPDYGMTAAVWTRIMLRVLHGVHSKDITWYNGRPADKRHGHLLGIDHDVPGVKLINLERDTALNEMIHRGEVDIAFGDDATVPLREGPEVYVFSTPEVLRATLTDLYQQEKASPVNHTVIIKKHFVDADPDLPARLYRAFEESKRLSYEEARQAAEGYLLFPDQDFSRQARQLGDDPYPFGLDENRRTLELIGEQLAMDGLLPKKPDIDRLWLKV
ncbi:MAG: hypothetical protein JOZ39_12550 [Chloroflexi bacterium]|nr:hypothetical protein [Chloroflexota bacterium]